MLDSKGKPIAGANVVRRGPTGRWILPILWEKTDAEGRFVLKSVTRDELTLGVMASGYAPELRKVTVRPGIPEVVIRLDPGKTIVGRVVDPSGRPVPEATIIAEGPWYNNGDFFRVSTTDIEGNFRWTDAPESQVPLRADKEDYFSAEWKRLAPSDKAHTFTLMPALQIHGKVIDEQMGQMISNFKIILGRDWKNSGHIQWHREKLNCDTAVVLPKGPYKVKFAEVRAAAFYIRIESQGYEPAVSRAFSYTDVDTSFDFKMSKSAWIKGRVLSPQVQPLKGVEVLLATGGPRRQWANIINGQSPSWAGNVVVKTGPDGRFSLSKPASLFALLAVHKEGCAEISQEQLATSPDIVLQPWGRIEGTLRIGSKLGSDKEVSFSRHTSRWPAEPVMNYSSAAKTGPDGKFVLTNIPPGLGWVGRSVRYRYPNHTTASHAVPVEVQPGQVTRVSIGGKGRPIEGQIRCPAGIDPQQVVWMGLHISLRLGKTQTPEGWQDMDNDQKRAWDYAWRKSSEGKRRWRARRNYSTMVRADGSFRIDDVPAGTYNLHARAYRKPAQPTRQHIYLRNRPIGVISYEFIVPKMPGGRSDEPMDLGILELKPVKDRPVTQPVGSERIDR